MSMSASSAIRRLSARTTRRVPRRGRRRRSARSRARPRSSAGRPAPPSTSGPAPAIPRGRPRPPDDSPGAAFRRIALRRVPAWARSVSGYEQRSLLGNPRPGRDLHDAGDCACTRARAHLAQALPETASTLVPLRPDQRELAAGRLGQRDQLEPECEHRCGELRELRPERRPQYPPLRARLAQRHRPPPRASADEPRRERDLADLPPTALGAREDPVEQCRQRPPEGQLVADRLRELEPLGDLRRRPASAYLRRVFTPRQAVGAPAVRPQSFGNGGTRQPGKLSDLLHPELLELLAPPLFERKQCQRERREELLRLLVGDDEGLARAC